MPPVKLPHDDEAFRVETDLMSPFRPLDRIEDRSLVLGGKFCESVKTIVWKDVPRLKIGQETESGTNRAYCASTGELLLCTHPLHQNPYRPIHEAPTQTKLFKHHYGTGYNNMVDFSVRKKIMTCRHRHIIKDKDRNCVLNVRLTPKPTVYVGNGDEVCAEVIENPPYLREVKSWAIVNPGMRTLAVVRAPPRPLITNVNLGIGQEYQVEVAAGVDWTAVLAVVQVLSMYMSRGLSLAESTTPSHPVPLVILVNHSQTHEMDKY